LTTLGLVDAVVPEPEGGAHWDKERALALLKDAIEAELAALIMQPTQERLLKRQEKYFTMGQHATRGR
jgi:acetyl-CoA carboxylase carboxyl transferase subunit alpha